MYNPSFGRFTLQRHIRKTDFRAFPKLVDDTIRADIVSSASHLARNGFSTLQLRTNNLGGRIIYQLTDLPTELVLRKAVQNLRKISTTKQGNRSEIIQRLKLLLQEGMPYFVAKFDIAEFYKSINQDRLIDLVGRRFLTAPSTRHVLDSFLHQCSLKGISGVPQGLAISAALSELYMQDFDQHMRTDSASYFFARYVDDIILIADPSIPPKKLYQAVSHRLPFGLRLNNSKTQTLEFGSTIFANEAIEHQFDYLGYSFGVCGIQRVKGIRKRKLTIDIAQSKIKKRKTRIILALLTFLQDNNFVDLNDRLKLIAYNYRFFDHRRARHRNTGICYDYELISVPSSTIDELDQFLRNILLCGSGKIGAPLTHALTKTQRNELLRLSFARGFSKKIHFHYSSDRLKQLVACWKYA